MVIHIIHKFTFVKKKPYFILGLGCLILMYNNMPFSLFSFEISLHQSKCKQQITQHQQAEKLKVLLTT